jgi:TonB family protein
MSPRGLFLGPGMNADQYIAIPAAARAPHRLLAALLASVVLHASAAVAVTSTPGGTPGTRSKPVYAPLQTRLASDSRVAGFVAGAQEMSAAATPKDGATQPAGGAVSPIYYKRSQLDARAYLVTRVDPVYPSGIPPTGGKARIRLFINERGFVDRVAIEESRASAKFGEAAAAAFRTAQFEPGKLKGVAVKSQILIEVDFQPLLPRGVK